MGDIGLILPANIPDLSPWLSKNRYNHTDFSVPQLATTVQEKNLSITVLIPAKEVSSTIGDVIRRTVRPLLDARVIHRIVVIDAASQDGTAGLAIEAGSQVLQRADIASELGSSLGKGDALWRGLLATDGDIVAFLDGDTEDPVPAHLIGIIGPLIMFDGIQMVRACFDRPFKSRNGNITPHGGGRVTEIMARPILNMHWPELAVFRQPLAGEFAARRTMLEELHFPVGYGVEIGTLIDAYHLVGLDALAEVDIGQRQNVHKPLRDLTTMAGTVLATAEQRRLSQQSPTGGKMYIPWLNIHQEIDTTERPPIRRYRASHQQYPSPPFVTVGHVRMFRDIGGDPTSSLRPGLIFRSGDASTLTQSGVKILLELGIRTIFDLRSPIELKDHSEVHGTNNENTPNHSPYQIYPNRISEFGIERVAAPVFADEEWHQDRRAARLMQYSNAAQVSGLSQVVVW
jgi:glucosyl-3-phosphoglycerate synthase